MASSWWPFWPFSKGVSSSSPANFLHLSRTNIERICELISHEEPLNPYQCRSMSSMLERTMRSIERIVDSVEDVSLVCGSAALENFYRVSEKGKLLVENCCGVDWCQEAAFQIQNEEAFKEIFLETSLCYNTICGIVENMNGSNREFFYENLRETSTFDPSSADEVFKDLVALQERLKDLVNDANLSSSHIRSQHLGKYLLGRVNCALQRSNLEDFDVRSFNLWSDGQGPDGEWSKESEYLGGNVCKTAWLDVPCAKKLFKDEMQEDDWLAEAKILASLNHPNIVKFLCCNKYETTHSWGHFIAMEQMETSLGSFIRRLKQEGSKVSLFLALDIILQIAYGMCYLHENGIAHRDLKTSNVVVRRVGAPQLQYYLQVKVVDFGISKVKLQDKSNTITRPKIGTTVYMPPEAFSNGRANWFKADVYSFAVMCSVILTGSEPFQDIKRNDLSGEICSGRRPKLPGDIPQQLALVIKEGWSTDRNLRPNFVDICTRLEKLRHWLLRDSVPTHGLVLEQAKLDSNLYIEKMLQRRSEACEHDRSHVRPQMPFLLTEEEDWFDGDEQQLSVQAQQLLRQQRGAQNAGGSVGGFRASPPNVQLLQQNPSHPQQPAHQQPTLALRAQQVLGTEKESMKKDQSASQPSLSTESTESGPQSATIHIGFSDSVQNRELLQDLEASVNPCPRCDSVNTFFCYYYNYNVNQPRRFCRQCQRYWTAGVSLKNIPVGGGRRRNKHIQLHNCQPALTQLDIMAPHYRRSRSSSASVSSSLGLPAQELPLPSTRLTLQYPPWEIQLLGILKR